MKYSLLMGSKAEILWSKSSVASSITGKCVHSMIYNPSV